MYAKLIAIMMLFALPVMANDIYVTQSGATLDLDITQDGQTILLVIVQHHQV